MKKTLALLTICLLLLSLIIYKSISYNPHHIVTRTEYLTSNKIDGVLDDTKIVFFSDLHIGKFTKEDDLTNCITLINSLEPDLIVFGGDLIDHYSSTSISKEQKQTIIQSLKSLKAPQGKYFILGNHDLESDKSREEINEILISANFISLVNTNFQIYNKTNSFFNIVGLDSLIYGEPNINEAYNNIDNSKYTLTFVHCPDLFEELPLENTDYVIASHSHGGQIYIPLLNYLYRVNGCNKYFYGKHSKKTTTLDISNGVGLTSYSIRFLANAEIVLYKLRSN